MRLTMQTDHGLRILMTLAARPHDTRSVDDLARFLKVSKNHLMKTAQSLVAGGFVQSVRGRHGGLKLKDDFSQIKVGAVIAHMEPDFAMAACFQNQYCCFLPQCHLRGLLCDARDAFMATLNQATLGDICLPSAPNPVKKSDDTITTTR